MAAETPMTIATMMTTIMPKLLNSHRLVMLLLRGANAAAPFLPVWFCGLFGNYSTHL